MFTQRKNTKTAKDIAHEQAVQRQLGDIDYDTSPTCIKCGEHYPAARLALGYRTCLDCGSPAKTYTIVPVPKSNYIIASSPNDVRSPYSHKGRQG
jgi:tRNA(Ile2) C34 agmatinyltransferase TiaS